MAHKRRLIQISNDFHAAAMHHRERHGYSEQGERLSAVGMLFGELAEMGERAELSFRTHGTICDTTWRYIRENFHDLAVNVLGRTDIPDIPGMPTTAEATAGAAD